MKLGDVGAAGMLMQAVDILRDQGQLRYVAGQLGKRDMSRIGAGFGNKFAAPSIPAPDEFGVRSKSFRGSEIQRVVLCRQTALASRKVGTPLSAETPAPVRARICCASRNAAISVSGICNGSSKCRSGSELSQYVVQNAAMLVVVTLFRRVDAHLGIECRGAAIRRSCRNAYVFRAGISLAGDVESFCSR